MRKVPIIYRLLLTDQLRHFGPIEACQRDLDPDYLLIPNSTAGNSEHIRHVTAVYDIYTYQHVSSNSMEVFVSMLDLILRYLDLISTRQTVKL